MSKRVISCSNKGFAKTKSKLGYQKCWMARRGIDSKSH